MSTTSKQLRLTFLLLITLLFPTLSLHAQDSGRSPQDQANLNRVLTAYSEKFAWQTYTSRSVTNLDSAQTLALDQNVPQYASLETLNIQFDGTYLPELRATDGNYSGTSTRTEWSGINSTFNATTEDEFAIIALDSQIYINGQRTYTGILADTSTPSTLNTFTLFSPELATILTNAPISRLADYNTFPTFDNIRSLLENAAEITDLGIQSPLNTDVEAHAYQLDINPIDGITAFNLDIDRLLNNPNLPPTFNRDAFYDQLASTATMTLTVYLNSETDKLISQQISLSADIQLSDRDVARENSVFQLAFTYHHIESFTNINAAFEFELPIAAQ